MKNYLLPLLLAISLFTGCTSSYFATRGGSASSTANGVAATLHQSNDPGATSKQTQEVKRTESFVLPQGSKIVEKTPVELPSGKISALEKSYEVSKATPVHVDTVVKTGTELGAAHKNKAAEIAAKITAMRPLQYGGFVLIVLAAACFTPWLQVITGGSKTFPIILGIAGFVLVLAPAVIPGYEPIILAFGLGVPTIWFIAHRHGEHKATSKTLSDTLPK